MANQKTVKYNTKLEHLFCIALRVWGKIGCPRWYESILISPILKLAIYLRQDWRIHGG